MEQVKILHLKSYFNKSDSHQHILKVQKTKALIMPNDLFKIHVYGIIGL